MILVLDFAGFALLLSIALALIFEILALYLHTPTISDIVQKFGAKYRFVLALIEALVIVFLVVLGVHFLGGF